MCTLIERSIHHNLLVYGEKLDQKIAILENNAFSEININDITNLIQEKINKSSAESKKLLNLIKENPNIKFNNLKKQIIPWLENVLENTIYKVNLDHTKQANKIVKICKCK